MPKVIIDLFKTHGQIEVASIYVPLSRVTRLNEPLILHPFLFSKLQVKPLAVQVQGLNGLQKIEQEIRKHFHSIVWNPMQTIATAATFIFADSWLSFQTNISSLFAIVVLLKAVAFYIDCLCSFL